MNEQYAFVRDAPFSLSGFTGVNGPLVVINSKLLINHFDMTIFSFVIVDGNFVPIKVFYV